MIKKGDLCYRLFKAKGFRWEVTGNTAKITSTSKNRNAGKNSRQGKDIKKDYAYVTSFL